MVEERSPLPRREEDQTVADYLAKIGKFIDRLPKLFAVGGALVIFAGWFGARSSSPGQRISTLESRAGAGFDTVDARLDSLEHDRVENRALRADVNLLLKLGCRAINDVDLRTDCVERGVRARR